MKVLKGGGGGIRKEHSRFTEEIFRSKLRGVKEPFLIERVCRKFGGCSANTAITVLKRPKWRRQTCKEKGRKKVGLALGYSQKR